MVRVTLNTESNFPPAGRQKPCIPNPFYYLFQAGSKSKHVNVSIGPNGRTGRIILRRTRLEPGPPRWLFS